MLPDLLSSEQLDISKTTHSNKRLREEDIGYDECFPELDLPSLEELKNYREKHGISIKEAAKKSFADKKHYEEKKNKNKKKHLEQEAMKIKQVFFFYHFLNKLLFLDVARKRLENFFQLI